MVLKITGGYSRFHTFNSLHNTSKKGKFPTPFTSLCKTKSLIQELWKTPPTHPWYNRQAPGGALSIKADRVVQTTISRLASGHIRGLSFNLGQEIYENCTKCNLVQATPDHLLFCAGLEREDIYSSPLLVYDFLRTLGLMDLV
ncbi:RNase H domain-containing protein [Trichonephila clavipes]|nr:RNase H domain-containing protein [Trichonephila clavipes]